MSARLITGRPLMAGMRAISWLRRTRRRGQSRPAPTRPSRPGHPSRPVTASPRSGETAPSRIPGKSRGVECLLRWASWDAAGQAADRGLCRGAARSAALRGGPVGRRARPATGRTQVALGRGRPRPRPVLAAPKPTVPPGCGLSSSRTRRAGSLGGFRLRSQVRRPAGHLIAQRPPTARSKHGTWSPSPLTPPEPARHSGPCDGSPP